MKSNESKPNLLPFFAMCESYISLHVHCHVISCHIITSCQLYISSILCSCLLNFNFVIVCDNLYRARLQRPVLTMLASSPIVLLPKPNAVWITSLCKAFPCYVPVTSSLLPVEFHHVAMDVPLLPTHASFFSVHKFIFAGV